MTLIIGIISFIIGILTIEIFRYSFDFHSFIKKQKNNWIGFDLDGTLAISENGKFDPSKIGEPLPEIVNIVKKYLDEGMEIKIFTARVSTNGTFLSLYHAIVGRYYIQLWTKKYLGQKLKVICTKDFKMNLLYDDRVIQVKTDAGKLVNEE